MAGNIVKWWKHKILGGYKQFSVLQECTTDSEELIYPVRAPSSCSAPPDLLMVSDRETVQLKQSANMISASKGHHPDNHHHHHNQHHHHSHNHNQPSQYSHHSQTHQQHNQQQHHQPKDHHQNKKAALVNKNQESPLVDLESAELNGSGGGKSGPDERIRLEEFTCDVSVESGKSSQPLQFSFTFYDLDGHHGKITKDDIAGIVYTIYESIGKSVVVPYCGSKTINVRLTVSPEAKSKSSKLKKVNTATTTTTVALGEGSGGSASAEAGNDVGGPEQTASGQHHSSLAGRRQHRYRPRKLIKSDDEEDDAESDSEKEISKKISSLGNNSNSNKFNDNHIESKLCCTDEAARNHRLSHSSHHTHQHQQPSTSCKFQPLNITENIYESVSNLKFGGRDASRKDDGIVVECKECVQSNLSEAVRRHHQQHAKHILTRTKLLRRTRKHKDQCVAESRQRSLSVGNESSWKMCGVHLSKNVSATAASASTTSTTNATGAPTIVDEVDGNGGGGGSNQGSPPNTECWNNALKRNDLIDIIRASMEKNRLCFQGSGKPYHHQNGLSPGRHRQRSHTISKIVNDSNTGEISHHQQQQQPHQHHHQQQQQHQLQQQQTSHHIPIYHQQMAINPALLTPHPKTNLCGYDSFLHATICTPSSTSANNSPNSAPVPNSQHHHQILSSPTTIVPPSTKAFLNNIRQQQRSGKQLRNGGYHSQQNSPQFHGGYLMEPQKLNSSLLNALNPHITSERKLIRTIDNVEKWLNEKEHLKCPTTDNPIKYDEGKLKKDEKNYDNLLYSKLNEKFLDVSTAAVVPSKKVLNNNNNNSNQSSSHHHNQSNKENERQHHHSHHHNHSPKQRHSKYSILAQNGSISPMNTLGTTTTTATGTTAIEVDRSKFVNLIPIDIDPVECENLIHPTTSDEDSSSLAPPTPIKEIASGSKFTGGKNAASASKKNSSANGDGVNNGGSGNSSSGASNNGNNSTSSTVHRYVHEHIHHHYHHFENKDD